MYTLCMCIPAITALVEATAGIICFTTPKMNRQDKLVNNY